MLSRAQAKRFNVMNIHVEYRYLCRSSYCCMFLFSWQRYRRLSTVHTHNASNMTIILFEMVFSPFRCRALKMCVWKFSLNSSVYMVRGVFVLETRIYVVRRRLVDKKKRGNKAENWISRRRKWRKSSIWNAKRIQCVCVIRNELQPTVSAWVKALRQW